MNGAKTLNQLNTEVLKSVCFEKKMTMVSRSLRKKKQIRTMNVTHMSRFYTENKIKYVSKFVLTRFEISMY